jgi:hypothetical protein
VEILTLYLPSEQKKLPQLIYLTCSSTISSGGIIIQIGYGQRVYEDHGKDLMEINKKRTDITNAAFVRLWMVNTFPICDYLSYPLVETRAHSIHSEIFTIVVPRCHFSQSCSKGCSFHL